MRSARMRKAGMQLGTHTRLLATQMRGLVIQRPSIIQGVRCTPAGLLGKLAYLQGSCLPATLRWLGLSTALGTSSRAAVLHQGILFDPPAQQLSANSAGRAARCAHSSGSLQSSRGAHPMAKRGPKKTGRKPGRPAVKKASTAPAKKGSGRPKGSGRSAKAGLQGRRGKHAAQSPTAAAQAAHAQAADPQKLNEARDSTADVQLEVVGTAVHPSFLVKEHSVKEMPKPKVTRRASKARLGVAKRSGVKKATSKKLNSIVPLLEKKASSWGSLAWDAVSAPFAHLTSSLKRLSGTA